MKPEFASRRYFGITRSKGKMYELGLPEESHIAIPEDVEPAALFPLSIGTLVDASAALNDTPDTQGCLSDELRAELGFAASFFDAYLASRFDTGISRETTLLASASYFLGQRPGSSLVLARRLSQDCDDAIEQLITWVLQADWRQGPNLPAHPLRDVLDELAKRLIKHFNEGMPSELVVEMLDVLRRHFYGRGSARDLVLVEVVSAVIKLRLASSAWTLLPGFSGLDNSAWSEAIRRYGFPKELWPSQKLLGKAGLFSGRSGVVQMPTSAGKTRSVEIILRSAFLADRTRVAVVVAPFRALCHEVASSLRHSFRGEDVKVNELSDALQLDFVDQLAELFGLQAPAIRYLLVLTPEKLLYVLRQEPALIAHIGLVVYDEGHQFDTGPRGITYELLLTEIKGLLQASAQTVLISAVIKNAVAVGTWLIGVEPNVVNGSGLLSTTRSVAFAKWHDRLGQLLFFESDNFSRSDYFVPRCIESQELARRGKERKPRCFPENGADAWKDVSLYLGIRLAPNGAVAVFCGRKDTATGLAERAVEVYGRGLSLVPPVAASDAGEIRRLVNLATKHFGEDSAIVRAAALGVFVHHGTTPQGLRLSIEHAMQNELIKFVACTSTLAQGVNLPIRYLIVSGVNQGADRIKTRDFQNLIGRAGRAGMHTEGLVLFADPRAIEEQWRKQAAVDLLQPENSEETSSSLLELLAPLRSPEGGIELEVPIETYFLKGELLEAWAFDVEKENPHLGFESRSLVKDISKRQKLLTALESYLMANRGTASQEESRLKVRDLAVSTLAYALADSSSKAELVRLFCLAAEYIERIAPEPARQFIFAKTLLNVNDASRVEHWVQQNEGRLRSLTTGEDWLQAVWPLFCEVIDEKLLTMMEPKGMPFQLARGWLHGASFHNLMEIARNSGATKPWGDGRRRLTEADVLDFFEGCLGFECPLVLAAVAQFLFGTTRFGNEGASALNDFQKSLKYGLTSRLAVSAYESGLADRCVAQHVADAIQLSGYDGSDFISAFRDRRNVITSVLDFYPAYFSAVIGDL
ncbi:DEAD/DEAH box helicase [Niveibacterium terrae]|uniref:DEAD/DEAH box helicase n=1 Tax=Niveibacterium terrae TaxID=3373598 RepID=UPI003A93F53E